MSVMGLELDICDTNLVLGLGRAAAPAQAPPAGSTAPSTCGNHRRSPLPLADVEVAAAAVHGPRACEAIRKEQSEGLQSSSHSTVTSNVKRERDADVEVEEEEDANAKKKLRLTKAQSALLEERFKEHSNLNPKQKLALAKQLNLRPRQVEVWFQNRRARTKLKQTEMDYQFLRRCCETLRGENRKLQKEVQELKAFKFSAALYMRLPAASTAAVCPSCETWLIGEAQENPKA